MGTKMKGIKGFYKGITNMFVVKERELEIGYPKDVKHVAHIGWDGQDNNNAPIWMKEFKTSSDFSALNVGELAVGEGGGVSISGRDFQQPMRSSDVHNESSSVKSTKKYKRKKIKSAASTPRSSSTRSSRTKTKFTKAVVEMESATTVQY